MKIFSTNDLEAFIEQADEGFEESLDAIVPALNELQKKEQIKGAKDAQINLRYLETPITMEKVLD